MKIRTRVVGFAAGLALVVGCSCTDDSMVMDGSLPEAGPLVDGGRDAGGGDAGGGDAGPPAGRCGDGELNAGEACDDGNRDADDFCNAMCQISCGDGVVNAVEVCDTGIAATDPGACPASCDDSDACTSDVLGGVDCLAECSHAAISACANDDGCCPAGCGVATDNDCMTTCGDMVLEPGELCEDGTSTPCPTACDDMNSCTMNVLTGAAATCDAECNFPDIAACSATSDGCCPAACDSTTDADCSASCGNMIFEPPLELCEDGTSTPCPTSCDDGMACTRNVLSGMPSMCNVECSFPAITACSATGDGCCPGTCNATTDADCTPVCGNSVTESPETCDDGNTTSGDGCDSMCRSEGVPPTAFRLTDLDLRDPHAFARVIFCVDITNNLNTELQTAITTDGDMPADGILDLSFVLVFRPLQQSAMRGSVDFVDADCTVPAASTMCTLPAGSTPLASGMYTNRTTGNCLDTMVGGSSVVRPYSPAVTVPMAPCFVTDPQTIVVSLTGLSLTLYDAQVAATYLGSPATGLRNGLLRGFITQTDAEATVLPATLPIVGGRTLASVLRGGMGNCSGGSDMDTHATLGRGWWFFLNFPATQVPYSEP